MILPDVNVLFHAYVTSAEQHASYAEWLAAAVHQEDVLLPDSVLTGFLRVVTNVRVVQPPVTIGAATSFVTALRSAPRARGVEGTDAVWRRFVALSDRDGGIRGNLVPDAYIAAAALAHSARVATRDRGFGRYPGLRWFDPAAP